MKCKIAFLSLIMLFVVILSGLVSAAGSDNNIRLQMMQNQSQTDVAALPDPVNTRTHYNSTDIQPIIDDNNTLNGDTIIIKGGFKYGPIILNKTLALVWDGTGTKPIISSLYINSKGSGSTINGLDIRYDGSLNPVTGITLNGTNNVVIKNCIINGFKMGLYQLNSSGSIIQSNYITNNSFYGIRLINSTTTINGFNNITNNEGFGIHSQDSAVHIESNTIGGSRADNLNGLSGIFIDYTSPSNIVNIIKNNVIGYNGFNSYSNLNSNGIILLNARGSNVIQNNIIKNNRGDGIFMDNSAATIINNQINNSVNGYGIGLFDASNAAIVKNQICNNWIGIYSKNSAADIKNNIVGNNQDYQIFLDNTSSNGVISNDIYGNHGTYFNAYNQLLQFNRIVTKYCSIENFGAVLDANFNWWGSNSGPIAAKIEGTGTNIDSWLVLSVIAQPGTIWTNGISTIIADLKHDNNGNIHNERYVLDGMQVNFSDTTLGTVSSPSSSTVNGIATIIFTARAITGLIDIGATVDNQNVSTNISVVVLPIVNVTPDQGNFYAPVNISLNVDGKYPPYKIFFTTNGSTPIINSAQYNEPITFCTTHTLKYFVQDSFGNISQIYTKKYNIYRKVTYRYSVRVPVKKLYKSKGKWKFKYATFKVKKWYKSWYKYRGKWRYKWRYKWITVIKYVKVYKTEYKWVLT